MQEDFHNPLTVQFPPTFRNALQNFNSLFPLNRMGVIVLIALPNVYAGMRLEAWRSEFPSSTESALWLAACFIIRDAPVTLFFLLDCVFSLIQRVFPLLYRRVMDDHVPRNTSPSCCDYEWFYFFCIPARIFLLLESFISLRRVPIGCLYCCSMGSKHPPCLMCLIALALVWLSPTRGTVIPCMKECRDNFQITYHLGDSLIQ